MPECGVVRSLWGKRCEPGRVADVTGAWPCWGLLLVAVELPVGEGQGPREQRGVRHTSGSLVCGRRPPTGGNAARGLSEGASDFLA
jgi:hypothetical protein